MATGTLSGSAKTPTTAKGQSPADKPGRGSALTGTMTPTRAGIGDKVTWRQRTP